MTHCPEQLTLSFYQHKQLVADFKGGQISSDTGLLAVRELDQKLGWLGPALSYLERFVGASKAAAGSPLVQRATHRMAEIRRTSSLVNLEVAPSGARVVVEGQPAMTSPIQEKVRLRNGWHRVTATLSGHGTVQKMFQVGPGLANRVAVRLIPGRPGRRVEPPPRPRLGPGHGSRPRPRPRLRPRPNSGRKPGHLIGPSLVPGHGPGQRTKPGVRGLRIAGWTSIALAGASVVAGAVLGGLSLKAKRNVEDAPEKAVWEPDLASDYKKAGQYRTGAWAAGGVGAALLITGVVLLVVDGKRAREVQRVGQRHRQVWVRPEVGPGQVSVSLGLRL